VIYDSPNSIPNKFANVVEGQLKERKRGTMDRCAIAPVVLIGPGRIYFQTQRERERESVIFKNPLQGLAKVKNVLLP